MPKPTASRGDDGKIMRQGHTASSNFGADPDKKRRTSTEVRPLKPR
jgi:hypothetical protein